MNERYDVLIYDENRVIYAATEPYIACVFRYDKNGQQIYYHDTYGLVMEDDYDYISGNYEHRENHDYESVDWMSFYR